MTDERRLDAHPRSRPPLCLYALDRPALRAFTEELRAVLRADDAAGLARLLELGDALAGRLRERERLVDFFLVPDDDALAAPLVASLRRVAKKRALDKVFTSPDAALEGRLRGFEPLREEPEIAARIDKLLEPRRLPWYLRRHGATGGWLDDADRERLVAALREIEPLLTPELAAFARSLADLDGDVIAHDAL